MDTKVKLGRIAGLLYLMIIIFGIIAQVLVRDSLVDYGNATITANTIQASEKWYRFGFVSELLMLICDIGVTTILYLLLQATSKGLSLLSTLLRLASIVILAVTALSHYAALGLYGVDDYLSVFTSAQRNALALYAVKLHGAGYNISLLFFGVHLILLGYLVFKAELFPKLPGILLAIGGVCYCVNSLVWFQFPAWVKFIYPAILIPCALGEWIFCVWLIAKGVRLK